MIPSRTSTVFPLLVLWDSWSSFSQVPFVRNPRPHSNSVTFFKLTLWTCWNTWKAKKKKKKCKHILPVFKMYLFFKWSFAKWFFWIWERKCGLLRKGSSVQPWGNFRSKLREAEQGGAPSQLCQLESKKSGVTLSTKPDRNTKMIWAN